MEKLFDNPLSIIALCVGAYQLGFFVQKRTKLVILNPLLIAITAIIIFLSLTGISLEKFNHGGVMIDMLLCPATMMLAVPMYRQREAIRKNFLPIIVGTLVGSVVSMGSVYLLCDFMGISDKLTMSLMPKSTTTPIAMEIAGVLGGIPAIAVAAVIFTGILGNIFAPLLLRLLDIRSRVAAGLAIGTASHALGTARAVEIGEKEAAFSGIAVGVAGMISVVIALCIK